MQENDLEQPKPSVNKILVSASKGSDKKSAYSHRHFYEVDLKNLEQLASLLLAKAWSPITWKDGLRLSQNFASSQIIALDFDDGRLTLENAKQLLDEAGASYILATTKSHQKEKTSSSGTVTKACDRFRVVMVWDKPITDKNIYEYNMRFNMELWPCDPSCKDSARFFFPCREIVSLKKGSRIKVLEIPKNETKEELKRRNDETMKRHKEEGTLPAWLEAAIAFGCEEGGRHTLCYRIGANMEKLGYTEEETIKLIMSGPLKHIGQQDVERAVANGAERARKE